MSVLTATSYSMADVDRTLCQELSGSAWASSSDVPGDSEATTSVTNGGTDSTWVRPWYDSGTPSGAGQTPSGTNYAVVYRAKYGDASFTDAGLADARLGAGRSGSEGVCVGVEVSTGNATLYVAGTKVDTSEEAEWGPAAWERVFIVVDHQDGGEIAVYFDADTSEAVLSYTLTSSDVTALGGLPDQFYFELDGGTWYVTDTIAVDMDDGSGIVSVESLLTASVAAPAVDGGGTYQDGTGDYTDVDERPPSNVDSIEFSSPNDAHTISFADLPASVDHVFWVQTLMGVMIQSGNAANSDYYDLRAENGVNEREIGTFTGPSDGDAVGIWPTDANSADWTVDEFNATNFGIVARETL